MIEEGVRFRAPPGVSFIRRRQLDQAWRPGWDTHIRSLLDTAYQRPAPLPGN